MTEVWAATFTRVIREGFLEEVMFGQIPNDAKGSVLGRAGVEEIGTVNMVALR